MSNETTTSTEAFADAARPQRCVVCATKMQPAVIDGKDVMQCPNCNYVDFG